MGTHTHTHTHTRIHGVPIASPSCCVLRTFGNGLAQLRCPASLCLWPCLLIPSRKRKGSHIVMPASSSFSTVLAQGFRESWLAVGLPLINTTIHYRPIFIWFIIFLPSFPSFLLYIYSSWDSEQQLYVHGRASSLFVNIGLGKDMLTCMYLPLPHMCKSFGWWGC
ncbi:hypothetical protein F4808DRAFT_234730 [Astrocystis sublimbata]|nr:hypothetical protein F4808DRAFT_234730 [Astrocystis sublimbata]